MTPFLDQVSRIRTADKHQVLRSTELLADQCREAWTQLQSLTLPQSYLKVNRVIVAGMGGSHLGAQIIQSVYYPTLKLPFSIVNQYLPPGYLDQHTLVIATSYSGNTEEAVEFVRQALDRRAKIVCVAGGGLLADFARSHRLPAYIFTSHSNPSKIPRYGYGYLFISQLALLAKIRALTLTQADVDELILTVSAQQTRYSLTVSTAANPAKLLAHQLQGRIPLLVAGEHLRGPAYVFRNQLHESAKNLSHLFIIPELNHHLLEGLGHPPTNPKTHIFVFFESGLYHPRNRKRFAVTRDIVTQQKFRTAAFRPLTASALSQAFETLVFTSYTAFYLAQLNRVAPGPNPLVDLIKSKL